jgi:hypothetical protein
MTTSKDVKKEPARTRINTPDSMAFYRKNFGTVEHHHDGAYYPEPKNLFNSSMTDSTSQDLSESSTESETNLMPIEQNQGGFFYNWTYPFHAKTGKDE